MQLITQPFVNLPEIFWTVFSVHCWCCSKSEVITCKIFQHSFTRKWQLRHKIKKDIINKNFFWIRNCWSCSWSRRRNCNSCSCCAQIQMSNWKEGIQDHPKTMLLYWNSQKEIWRCSRQLQKSFWQQKRGTSIWTKDYREKRWGKVVTCKAVTK